MVVCLNNLILFYAEATRSSSILLQGTKEETLVENVDHAKVSSFIPRSSRVSHLLDKWCIPASDHQSPWLTDFKDPGVFIAMERYCKTLGENDMQLGGGRGQVQNNCEMG
ncbi:hypothetical protein TNCT_483621 [Trichonephila clavata]|uniref:Uncharacterized protein n=1 Tax=Trichonephila clavata TaxID=2740835 RepID=A0A8X6F0S2_TRICU|nr:hypothetical protein TNCT_483621 [Trichonephila clavata]